MSDPTPASAVLFLLGASHHTAPLELRERLALTAEKMSVFCAQAARIAGLRELAVLNTCNRVEFYGVAENHDSIERLQEKFCSLQGFTLPEFAAIREHAAGREALVHLLEVSCGLASQMLGETEILGQVKDAYATAQSRQSVGPVLNRVFQKTFQYAKYVRTQTAINEGQISVANVAVDLAQKIFGQLTRTRILLLGAGEIGEKTAKAFQSRGAGALTVTSRRLERAMELASTLGANALPFEHFSGKLSEFDIVVGSTASPEFIVTLADTVAAMKKRPAQPLFFIDLALPRDIEPSVAERENVFLYNLDDLAKIAEENLAARAAKVVRAKEILSEKVDALWKMIEPQVPRVESVAPQARPSSPAPSAT